MLLRYAVSPRKLTFWRGFPGSRRTTSNVPESTSASKNKKKGARNGKTIPTMSRHDDTERSKGKRANLPNFWRDLLANAEHGPDTLPEAQDLSWVDSNKPARKDWGPKNIREMYQNPKYPERLLPWTHHPVHSPVPPIPTTATELVHNLIAMRNAVPVVTLASIMRYHDSFPWLQSSESFDTVLELAVRHTAIGTARKLVLGMNSKRIAPTERTNALLTRLKVRVGDRIVMRLRRRWLPESTLGAHNSRGKIAKETPGESIGRLLEEAIEEELATLPQTTPLWALGEYFGTPLRGSPKEYRDAYLSSFRKDMKKALRFERRRIYMSRKGRLFLPKLTMASVSLEGSSRQSIYEVVSKDYCELVKRHPKDFVPVTPTSHALLDRMALTMQTEQNQETIHRIYSLLIRRLLLQGQRESAVKLATAHIQELCEPHATLSPFLIRKALRVIHLLLHTKYGCPSFSEGRNTLLALLRLHPGLQPEAKTLYVLLQNFQTVRRRGERAYEALRWFRKRWPNFEEDESVRRTVAKYGMQERTMAGHVIAREMATRQAERGSRWRTPRVMSQDLSSPRPRSFGKIYTRESREKQRWIDMGLVERGPGFVLKRDGPAGAAEARRRRIQTSDVEE